MKKYLMILALVCAMALIGGGAAYMEAAAAAPEATAGASLANPDGTYASQLLSQLPFTAEQWLADEPSRAYFTVFVLMDASVYPELGLNDDMEGYGLPAAYLATAAAEAEGSLTAYLFYEGAGHAWVCTYYPDAKTIRVELIEAPDGAAAQMAALKTAGTIGEYAEVARESISYALTELGTSFSE